MFITFLERLGTSTKLSDSNYNLKNTVIVKRTNTMEWATKYLLINLVYSTINNEAEYIKNQQISKIVKWV